MTSLSQCCHRIGPCERFDYFTIALNSVGLPKSANNFSPGEHKFAVVVFPHLLVLCQVVAMIFQ